MDIKCTVNEIHKKYTGHSNEVTLRNLELLTKERKQLLVRIPLINGVNTNADDFVRLFSSLDMSKAQVEILPYHEYGKCKWIEEYEIVDGFVSDEALRDFTDILKTTVNLIKT